ncbi:MAG: HAMP domain-containing sensor histidine kinase, partial [Planctomycetota bacterium]|nr:HAMP domain-containing sensor histidine kinase [Planctomycetota bacterium]
PLTVLQAHLAELARQAPGPHADAAVQEAQYLSSLLGNLAAVARLEDEASVLRQDAVDLAALTDRVVGRHGFLAGERSIELEHALPAERMEVRGEVTLLEQALGNLVHNGLRHGRDGGHVTVHLAPLGPDRFRLRVLDDGPGVPLSERALLGERRWRAEEARQRNPDGRGLGVAIARDVFERHGWVLSFHGEEGEGLEARIEGPRIEAPAHEAAS